MNLTYRSPQTEVRESPIHGRGLFAKEGIIPAEIQIGDGLYIAPSTAAEVPGAMVYSNHSCDPNIAIQGQIAFVAMRDIAAGEELTHDWATTDDLDEEMTCRCGSPKCRKVVTGKDWRLPELQARYAGWFCWHVQRKINGLATSR